MLQQKAVLGDRLFLWLTLLLNLVDEKDGLRYNGIVYKEARQMEELFRALAGLKGKKYDGSYIGRVIWSQSRGAVVVETKAQLEIVRETRKYMKIRIEKQQQALEVVLLFPGEKSPAVASEELPAESAANFLHCFTSEEIQRFTAATGDENPIHAGANPVVPGLQLLQCLQQKYPAAEHIDLRFLQPVYGGEPVYLQREDGLQYGIAGRRRIFAAEITEE